MTTVHIDGESVLVEVPDAKGEVFLYRASAAPPGLDEWAVSVAKAGEGGPGYRVGVDRSGSWRCGCADWRYRHRPGPAGCKHVEAAKQIRKLINLLEGVDRGRERRGRTEGAAPG